MDSKYNLQMCAFPPCTKSFPQPKNGKKYCSGCCRAKDCNRRKRLQEGGSSVVPVRPQDTNPSAVDPISFSAPPTMLNQKENVQPEPKRVMSLVGVGESAIGAAGVLFLKDQLLDKNHRAQLQNQMNQLLQQQAIIAGQLKEIKQAMLIKDKGNLIWDEGFMM